VVKQKIQALFDAGLHAEVKNLLGKTGISDHDRKMLESIHPMYMGGNYLPDADEGEVEIARISIASTTCDVTSVYARFDKGMIHYRVVDEYNGETLCGLGNVASYLPLCLGSLADFFLETWPLVAVLESNFDDDLEASLDFFSASSDFYPQFDLLCRQRVIDAFPHALDDE